MCVYVCVCVHSHTCCSIIHYFSAASTCFFTSDSTMKKVEFMKMINKSYKQGGLTCSFNDFQLSEFVQHKRRKASEEACSGEGGASG